MAVTPCSDIEEAIRLANDTNYGSKRRDFHARFVSGIAVCREVDSGNLHVNWGPQWRADLMPYGGLKESGMGEGRAKYVIEEMTEMKTVIIHGL